MRAWKSRKLDGRYSAGRNEAPESRHLSAQSSCAESRSVKTVDLKPCPFFPQDNGAQTSAFLVSLLRSALLPLCFVSLQWPGGARRRRCGDAVILPAGWRVEVERPLRGHERDQRTLRRLVTAPLTGSWSHPLADVGAGREIALDVGEHPGA